LIYKRVKQQKLVGENSLMGSKLNGKIIPSKKAVFTVEQEELQRLCKENKRLRLEYEILKKTATFFVNEPV